MPQGMGTYGSKKADLLKRKKIRKRNLKRKNDLFVWFRRV